MRSNRITSTLSMSLAIGALATILPAHADEYVVERSVVAPDTTILGPATTVQRTFIAPELIVPPTSRYTVEKSVVVPAPTEFSVERSVVVPAPTAYSVEKSVVLPAPAVVVPDSTVTSRRIEVTSTPAPAATTTIVMQNGPGLPAFATRLSNMRDQIDLAASRGWITQLQADGLRQRVTQISIMNDNLCRNGFDRFLSDQIEHDANLLNIAIQDSMKLSPPIGSAPQFFE